MQQVSEMKAAEMAKPWSFNPQGDVFSLRTAAPPRPWHNLHYSEPNGRAYYSLVSQAGMGSVFVRDEAGNKTFLTRGDEGERVIYFSREDTGKMWTIGGYPVIQPVEGYRCDYTPASTRLESTFEGITCSQRIFVPLEAMFEIWTVEVINHTDEPQTINVFPYVSVELGGFPILFRYNKTGRIHTTWQDEIGGLFTKNDSPFAPSDIYSAFLISSQRPAAATGKPDDLFHFPHSFANPDLNGKWTKQLGYAYANTCMCLRVRVTLAPGEKKTINFAFGTAPKPEQVKPIAKTIGDQNAIESLLKEVQEHYRTLRAPIQVSTGDERIDRYINVWAPKQIESYLAFKKAVRDNLQVDAIYCSLDYKRSLENFLDVLSHQYAEGYMPHWFRPLVTFRYSDKPAWIPLTLAELIKESGDFSILNIELPYIDEKGNQVGRGSVLDHVMRAMRFMFKDTGVHGMNRMHYADWNDDLDGMSRVGEGESVLTSMIFAAGLREMIDLAKAMGDGELTRECSAMYEDLKRRLNETAWDGEWYMRGFSGNGEKIGSRECAHGRIFQNTQSWAILSGIANEDQQRRMLASVDQYLETDIGRRLYFPTYPEYLHHVGGLSAQPPDMGMNAVYNHACAFGLVAECMAGRNDKAWEILEKLVPDGRLNPSSQSRNEPFVVTNQFDLEESYYGRCGLPWRTGTAGWVYRGLVEYILGVRKDYGGLRIEPCLPTHIKRATLKRTFRGASYAIEIERLSTKEKRAPQILLDGKAIDGSLLPVCEAGSTHQVKVTM